MILEESTPREEKNDITLYFNGTSLKGTILSAEEYYAYPANSIYSELYVESIKKPREPHIEQFEKDGNINAFPDQLSQVFLHLLHSEGTIQIRLSDVVAFSFD